MNQKTLIARLCLVWLYIIAGCGQHPELGSPLHAQPKAPVDHSQLMAATLPLGACPTGPSHTPVWVSTGSMSTPRYAHTATPLSSGKVLVTGGQDNSGILATAELYDPATGSWSPTGNPGPPRR